MPGVVGRTLLSSLRVPYRSRCEVHLTLKSLFGCRGGVIS